MSILAGFSDALSGQIQAGLEARRQRALKQAETLDQINLLPQKAQTEKNIATNIWGMQFPGTAGVPGTGTDPSAATQPTTQPTQQLSSTTYPSANQPPASSDQDIQSAMDQVGPQRMAMPYGQQAIQEILQGQQSQQQPWQGSRGVYQTGQPQASAGANLASMINGGQQGQPGNDMQSLLNRVPEQMWTMQVGADGMMHPALSYPRRELLMKGLATQIDRQAALQAESGAPLSSPELANVTKSLTPVNSINPFRNGLTQNENFQKLQGVATKLNPQLIQNMVRSGSITAAHGRQLYGTSLGYSRTGVDPSTGKVWGEKPDGTQEVIQ